MKFILNIEGTSWPQ